MNTNICYCEAPWAGRSLPRFKVNRAHVPNRDCTTADHRPEWLRRGIRAKELTFA